MDNKRNTAYIFIPAFTQETEISKLVMSIDESEKWSVVNDRLKYMLKYAANKFDASNFEKCQCFHYVLNKKIEHEFVTGEKNVNGKNIRFGFKLLEVNLYCFRTGVIIFAFRVQFDESDPYYISTAEYYLKKVSRELIYYKNGEEEPFTFLDKAKEMVKGFGIDFEFFHYAEPTTERANILTYAEVGNKDDYKRELFYLRWCYREDFSYSDELDADEENIYKPTHGVVWGMSSEAAVCLVSTEKCGVEFAENILFKNFNAQYLFMYVLLLHQKYALYTFLTQIDVDIYNDLNKLENYKQKFYRFKTDFVFSEVTEVPQYRNLYEKLSKVFSLEGLMEDVKEPLLSLAEVKREENEKKEKKREDLMNIILFVIAIFSVISAIVDGKELISWLF